MLLDGGEPGGLEGLGLTREAIEEANDRLVHVALTPFGQEGPMAGWLGSDLVHQALGGQMMMNGYDDMPASPPVNGQGHQAGHMAGSWAFIAALAALQAGKGAFIDLSVHDACAGMTENALPQFDYTGKVVTRRTGRHASTAPTPAWQHRAADGRYINAQLVNVSPRAVGGARLVAGRARHGRGPDRPEVLRPGDIPRGGGPHLGGDRQVRGDEDGGRDLPRSAGAGRSSSAPSSTPRTCSTTLTCRRVTSGSSWTRASRTGCCGTPAAPS